MRTTPRFSACLAGKAVGRRIAVTTLAAALALATAGALPAGAATVPAGFHTVAAPAGGNLLEGTIDAASPATLLRAALGRARDAFGPITVAGATRSTDETLTVALFRARSNGVAVGGLVLATYVGGGASRVAIAYDRADRFGRTAPALIGRATQAPSGGTLTVPPLRPVVATDQSVSASLAPGWTPKIFAQGVFAASGPDGAEVDQEVAVHLIDPRSPVYQQNVAMLRRIGRAPGAFGNPYGLPLSYQPDPARAFIAVSTALAQMQGGGDPEITIEKTVAQPHQPGLTIAEISGTDTVKGVRTRFDGLVGVGAANQNGAWFVSVKMIAAPVAHFQADLPALIAIYNSYSVNQTERAAQVQQTIADDRAGTARGLAMAHAAQDANSATFNASMSHARSVQDGIDRSTAGFTRYLSDTTVLQSASGARGTVDAGFAQSVVDHDPQNFRVVPVSEYQKGVDY